MVEDVHITGLDWNDNNLPKWATEKTQEQILNALLKNYNISRESTKEVKDAVSNIAKGGRSTEEVKKLRKVIGQTAKKGLKDSKKQENLFRTLYEGGMDFLGSITGTSASLTHLRKGPLKMFGNALSFLGKKTLFLGGLLSGILGLIGKAISIVKETVSSFRSFNEVGIQVQGSILEFQASLVEVGMTVEEMASIVMEYSRTVGNVGIPAITRLTSAANTATFQFTQFGLTTAEATKYTTELLETQRLAGIFRVRDEARQRKAIQENIKRLTAYSKILNVSREEMLQQRKELLGRADVQRAFASMPEEMRMAAQASFTKLSDLFAAPELKPFMDRLTDMIASPVAQASASFQEIASVSPEVANQMAELAEKVKRGEDIDLTTFTDLEATINQLSKEGRFTYMAMSEQGADVANMLGGPVLNALRNGAENIRIWGEKAGEEGVSTVDAMAAAVDDNVQVATRLNNSLNMLNAAIDYATVSGFFTLLGGKGKDIIEGAISGIDAITNALLQGVGPDGIITRSMGFLHNTIMTMGNTMLEWFGPEGKISKALENLGIGGTTSKLAAGALGGGALVASGMGAFKGLKGTGKVIINALKAIPKVAGVAAAGAGAVASTPLLLGLAAAGGLYALNEKFDLTTKALDLFMDDYDPNEGMEKYNRPGNIKQTSESPDRLEITTPTIEETTDRQVEDLINNRYGAGSIEDILSDIRELNAMSVKKLDKIALSVSGKTLME